MKTSKEITTLIKTAVEELNSAAKTINEITNLIQNLGEGLTLAVSADTEQAKELGKPLNVDLPEKPYITAIPFPGFTPSQITAIKEAVSFWNKIILKGSPDGLQVDFNSSYIDNKGGTYAMASHTLINNETGLPTVGLVHFDINDLENLEKEGRLLDVIKHEICHVLGFGTLWEERGLLINKEFNNPLFTGKKAVKEFQALIFDESVYVPVEETGSIGTRHSHWRETVFEDELMTGYLNQGKNPLSRMTIASLEDLGYEVSYDVLNDINQED